MFSDVLLPMSLTGSVMIAAIILIRPLLKHWRTHGILALLWFAACALLLLPFRLPSPVSVYNLPALSDAFSVGASIAGSPNMTMYSGGYLLTVASGFDLRSVLPWVWIVGVCVSLAFAVASGLRLGWRFRDAVPRADLGALVGGAARVYASSRTAGPLTYGIFRPCIIVALSIDEMDHDAIKYMLLHECQHIRSRDGLVNLLWVLALCLHWFNPLVWLGWVCLRRDMEAKCDAKVLEQIGAGSRTGYAQTLLDMVPIRRTVFPLAFGSTSAVDRIKGILAYRPASRGAVAVSFAVMMLCVALFAANPVHAVGGGATFAVSVTFAAAAPDDSGIILFRVEPMGEANAAGIRSSAFIHVGSFSSYPEAQRFFVENYLVDAVILEQNMNLNSPYVSSYGFGVSAGGCGQVSVFSWSGLNISVVTDAGSVNYVLMDASTFDSEDFDLTQAVNELAARSWGVGFYEGEGPHRLVIAGN